MARPAARSIRGTLIVGVILLFCVVLGVTAWLAYLAGEHEALETFDARLATSARVLDALVVREPTNLEGPAQVVSVPAPVVESGEDGPNVLGHYYETKIAFQVLVDGPRIVVRSASAPTVPFAPLDPGFSTQSLPNGAWRVFVLRSGPRWIEVAEQVEIRDELSTMLALTTVTPLLFGLPALALFLSLLVRYGLAPLAELARRIEHRDPASLEPVVLTRTPAEVLPVVSALNGLLRRVNDTLARERRFTAAAAHELRTPLAALKLHAENVVRAGTERDRETSLSRMTASLRRTLRLVEQMLAFSRASAPPEAMPLTDVSLRAIVLDVVGDCSARAAAQRNRLVLAFMPDHDLFTVRGDLDKLTSLVTNLVENALRYGPEGGRVGIELACNEDGEISLAVSDQGPGIEPRFRERIFESYFRIPDTAGEGTGLGLAIVSEIAQQHGAAVEVTDGDGGHGTRMVVRFPAHSSVTGRQSAAAIA